MAIRNPSSDASHGPQVSGRHQSLRRDAGDRGQTQRLKDVGLEDEGEAFEDELRDRHSNGIPRPAEMN